ncbi:hypothetical protein HYDPIDRAFT_173193 [Hydnomerulius pinastri MD-312]|nr:hypothetical protein HYDPIDRAFT_173193 [Hydnomerulius pinastri MD-312]
MTTMPSVVTEVYTTTGPGGTATTITQAYLNPTLAPNSATGGSSFFKNTGAVVGVFVVVGLAAASIMLWILFAIRRRQRMRRIEQDTEVEAAVAAAGFNRTPLDDDDEGARSPHTRSHFSSEMGQRGSLLGYASGGSGSLPSGRPFSGAFEDFARNGFDPYADHPTEHAAGGNAEGYVPARTASPPPGAARQGRSGVGTDEFGSSGDRKSSYGHTPTYSAGSFEPLLANYAQNSSERDAPPAPPTPPPRNPKRLIDASQEQIDSAVPHDSNGYSSDGSADDRLDPGMKRRTRSDSLGSVDLRDHEDYSRPVLTVRNIPDAESQHSL